jgi:hypothetical protein
MISIQPVEADGQFWVRLNLDGDEMERRGPFANADEAGAMAAQLAGICRAMHAEVRMQAAPSEAAAPHEK